VADEVERALRGDVSVAEVAVAYMRYVHGPHDDDDPNWWAVELWQADEWWSDEERLRTGIVALVDAAETDLGYGVIGAAIIEYFIYDDEDRLAWLEAQAAKSEPFRHALANVYVWGHQQDRVAARVENAARTRLPRPIGWTGP
jgi:hypothetical protein